MGVTVSILSNLPHLGRVRGGECMVEHTAIGGTASIRAKLALLREIRRHDVVVLNAESQLLLGLCLWRTLWPFGRWKLVSLDLVLSRPVTGRQVIVAWVKKQLFRKVDRFILYFRDTGAYARWYGITPDRTSYVPFKVNIWSSVENARTLDSEGEYVLTVGRSKRDLDTFLKAMAEVKYPGVLLHQPSGILAQHGTTLPTSPLPENVTAVEDHGGQDSWIDFLRRAKIVVLATRAETISPSGISTYLDAMALRKCVVATESPATRGLLKDEAVVVPPADPKALATAIQSMWEDASAREAIARRGQAYAFTLQGEERLMRDIAAVVCGLMSSAADPVLTTVEDDPPSIR